MLKLNVYGSSSKGNCYFLTNGNDTLCLDLGVKKLDNLDWNNVSGIVLTHCHGDHCNGIKDIKNYYKGKYYSNKETLDKIPIIDEYNDIVFTGNVEDNKSNKFLIDNNESNEGFVFMDDL